MLDNCSLIPRPSHVLQVIQNWMVGRPGNEAVKIAFLGNNSMGVACETSLNSGLPHIQLIQKLEVEKSGDEANLTNFPL